jgi:hypothetical protein
MRAYLNWITADKTLVKDPALPEECESCGKLAFAQAMIPGTEAS